MAKGVKHYLKDGQQYTGETHKMPDDRCILVRHMERPVNGCTITMT
jgi:hypothetical protein